MHGKREAKAFELAERERAKQQAKVTVSPTSTKLDDVAGRYWSEIGKHHAGADTTWRDIERLIGYFGATKLLTEITDDDVAKLVAWRRGHRVTRHGKGKKKAAPVYRASHRQPQHDRGAQEDFHPREGVGHPVRQEPNWKQHWLKEPQERVRELQGREADGLRMPPARILSLSWSSPARPGCG